MTEPTRAPGGYDAAELRHIVTQACKISRLNDSNARLLRGHTNAVVLLPEDSVVMKVARRGTPTDTVQRTVQFVQWLMDRGFPTAPLHPDLEQPLIVDGHAVTFWTYLPQTEEHAVSASQIAKPLFALHNLPTPPIPLPPHDNVRAIRRSLAAITSLPAPELQFLSDCADQLEAALEQVTFALPKGLLQGDPQHRNALHHHGESLLIDWDTVSYGQPEWDLVTIEVHCRRFGYGPAHYQSFAEAYGYDVTTLPGYATLRDLRELRMITTNARKTRHAPQSVYEVKRRVEGLRRGDSGLPWHIL